MRSRLTKLGAAAAALVALAVGGSALASASNHAGSPAQAPAAAGPTGETGPTGQIGPTGETGPADNQSEAPDSGAADTDNLQQGDQTGNDQADSQSEPIVSESGPSDGPGGYADSAANADTQQQGEN